MKKHRIEGNLFLALFMVFWCLFIVAFMIIVTSTLGGTVTVFPFIIVASFMLITGLVILFKTISGVKKIRELKKNGKKGYGVIVSKNFGRNGSCFVIVKFKNDTNEECLTEFPVYSNREYFEVKETIPLLILGEYAYVDISRLGNHLEDKKEDISKLESENTVISNSIDKTDFKVEDNSKENDNNNISYQEAVKPSYSFEDDMIICKKCGAKNTNGLIFCINCGETLDNKETNFTGSDINYCPDCGTTAGKDDEYCRHCGKKLK